MGKHLLRDDTECQNCGHTVAENYCPHCGQKNTETRQSFGYLFAHFLEDLTHYDSAFWKTIKYLLFRPALLTREYLIGRRMAYVPPVKLYIFISFVTFVLPSFLPSASSKENSTVDVNTHNSDTPEKIIRTPDMRNKESVWFPSILVENNQVSIRPIGYTSVRQMDSVEALKPDSLRLNSLDYKVAKKLIYLHNHNTPEQVADKFFDAFMHNIPKVLFVYLPIFAFWLWIFHGKKRWYFFDHAIFSLHYFSFLLLNTTMLILLFTIARWFNSYGIWIVFWFLLFSALFWQVYYFYRAHRNMYYESWLINFIKSTLMFAINFISIITVIIIYFFITIYTLH